VFDPNHNAIKPSPATLTITMDVLPLPGSMNSKDPAYFERTSGRNFDALHISSLADQVLAVPFILIADEFERFCVRFQFELHGDGPGPREENDERTARTAVELIARGLRAAVRSEVPAHALAIEILQPFNYSPGHLQ
jgi:hypothetical protein